jgi:GNAT superfamily N-acetyltransferase
MTPDSLQVVDRFWAGDLGCAPEALRPQAPRVQVHGGGLQGYQGVFVLALGGAAPVVSAPPGLAAALAPRAAVFAGRAAADPEALRALLAPAPVTRVIGPASLAYADATTFVVPAPAARARPLAPNDRGAFDELAGACPPDDWTPKGFAFDGGPLFGAFGDRGELLAVAGFELWGDHLAHLSVVTHPAARGHGHGSAVVAAAARAALATGLVLQYRALEANLPSRGVARKLGFTPHGWSIAARLT